MLDYIYAGNSVFYEQNYIHFLFGISSVTDKSRIAAQHHSDQTETLHKLFWANKGIMYGHSAHYAHAFCA